MHIPERNPTNSVFQLTQIRKNIDYLLSAPKRKLDREWYVVSVAFVCPEKCRLYGMKSAAVVLSYGRYGEWDSCCSVQSFHTRRIRRNRGMQMIVLLWRCGS